MVLKISALWKTSREQHNSDVFLSAGFLHHQR
jgi:hypothetical protein